MPTFTPAPQEWIDAFNAALPKNAERRKMFGYPAAFVNGNMACGLFQDSIVFKLPEADRDALIDAGGKPMVVMGRTMKEFVVGPQELNSKTADLKKWINRSIAFAASLPPKAKKKKA